MAPAKKHPQFAVFYLVREYIGYTIYTIYSHTTSIPILNSKTNSLV